MRVPFDRLCRTYADYASSITLVNAAVSSVEGVGVMWTARTVPGDPDWVEQLSSFRRDVVESHDATVPGLKDRIEPTIVNRITLRRLVDEYALDHIDLLHIDAEGFDYDILQMIDYSAAWAPRAIMYESKHLGPDALRAEHLMTGNGYTIVAVGDGDTYVRRAQPGPTT